MSIKLGPHLRELPHERLVVADGFSCKTQIEQATGRRPLHLAQLLQIAQTWRRDPSIIATTGSKTRCVDNSS